MWLGISLMTVFDMFGSVVTLLKGYLTNKKKTHVRTFNSHQSQHRKRSFNKESRLLMDDKAYRMY